jgi:hypothetical protein
VACRHPQVVESLAADVQEHVMAAIACAPLLPLTAGGGGIVVASSAPREAKAAVRSAGGSDGDGDELADAELQAAEPAGDGVPPEASGCAAADVLTASAAHTAQLHTVLDHLVHAGCWRTAGFVSSVLARRLAAEGRPLATPSGEASTSATGAVAAAALSGAPSPGAAPADCGEGLPVASLAEMQQRRKIVQLVLDGNIDEVPHASLAY